MPTQKNETLQEAEVVEEKIEVNRGTYLGQRRYREGFFFGSVLLILGVFLILENYLAIDFMRYFWPVLLLLIGARLVYRSFNK